jgi:glycosyltransferase involved in cell wall biosynthesis
MSETPSVSVVIATYNRARLLPQTLDSIFAQSFRDFEVIVVDDGSTDDTREVLTPYQNRIQYVYQENCGPSAARNVGARRAKAGWLSFQDSDDLALSAHLDMLHTFVQAHPGCAMVVANGSYLGGPEHHRNTIIPTAKSRLLARRGMRLDDVFDKSIVRLQAALISKAAYEAVGGHDESLRICMDLDLSFRLLMEFPVAYIDEVVFAYRKHEGNIGRNEELRLMENIRVVEKLLRDYPRAREIIGGQKIAKRLAYRYYRLAKGRWKRRLRADARLALRRAIDLCPTNLKYRVYQMRWALAGSSAACTV